MVSRTTSSMLLERALPVIGEERLANTLQLTVEALQSFATGERRMTLPQQRVLALAVLALAEDEKELRRRAAALLSQVQAAEAFESGSDRRHAEPPPPHRAKS